jgi:hypothetical protein
MQTTNRVFMVRPAWFIGNPQTAASNHFQKPSAQAEPWQIQHQAVLAFDIYVQRLRAAGVDVMVIDDKKEYATPDSIFPNNWISTASDGRIVLYPMAAENRRRERQGKVLSELASAYQLTEHIDLSAYEQYGEFLEGTGSLVCDHENRLAYICRSVRSSEKVATVWQQYSGYRLQWFDAVDPQGKPIYHTNVMMSVGIKYALVCLEAVTDWGQRQALHRSLQESGRQVILLSYQQMMAFCGNVLELVGHQQQPVMAMSERAWRAFNPQQQALLADYAQIVQAPLDVIEDLGGGGARCMLAELFLGQKKRPALS